MQLFQVKHKETCILKINIRPIQNHVFSQCASKKEQKKDKYMCIELNKGL